MARKRRKNNQRELKKYLKLYVDGDTEILYFSKLAQNYRIKLSIEPDILHNLPSNEYRLNLILRRLKREQTNKNEIHVVSELDHYFNSNNEEYINKIKNFLENLKKLKIANVYLIYPCLELWFLFHFNKVNRPFSNCNEVINYIKNNLCRLLEEFILNLKNVNWLNQNYKNLFNANLVEANNIENLQNKLKNFKSKYCKTGNFIYEKNNNSFLKDLIELKLENFAINNAKSLDKFSFENKNNSLEIYKLVEFITKNN
jgi:hypothetical protein